MAIFLWRANVMLSSDSARPNRSTMVLEQATPPVPQGILCADRRNCVNSTVVVLFPLLFVFYLFDVGPFITDAVIDAAFLSAAAIGTGAKKKQGTWAVMVKRSSASPPSDSPLASM